MKITTWNVNSLKVRLPQVLEYLNHEDTDILALQELKMPTADFPHQAFAELGYESIANGQKTYNGVALVSRLPLSEMVFDNPYFAADFQKRIIAATVNGVRVINVYCVNGQEVASEKYVYKQQWFAALTVYLREELRSYPRLIVLGDFNIAPADADVYDPAAWREKIMCSAAERSWFQEILALGLTDSLRRLDPNSPLYTWWDYRLNAFKRNLGMRIDHILVSAALLPDNADFNIATTYRAAGRPSDHAPVALTLTC